MPYNFVADGFHTKKLCSRLSSSKVPFYTENGRFGILTHLWGLGATYDVHLRLIGKRIYSGFPISVNWTFSLGVTAEALRANIDWKSAISLHRGQLDPKCYVEGVVPTNYSSVHKTELNDLSCGIKIWPDLSFVLSQF